MAYPPGGVGMCRGLAQDVPRPANRAQILAVERPVDLAPQVAHVHLDHVGVTGEILAPHLLQQLALGHRFAGTTHQHLQQPVLPRRQRDVGSIAAHLATHGVQFQVAHDHRCQRTLVHPTGQRSQPGDQHHVAEGLAQEVVGAGIERLGLVVLAFFGRQHEDWRPHARLPQRSAHLETVHARKQDVQHDGVIGGRTGTFVAVLAVVGDVDVEPLLPQSVGNRRGQLYFVVNYQYSHRTIVTRHGIAGAFHRGPT